MLSFEDKTRYSEDESKELIAASRAVRTLGLLLLASNLLQLGLGEGLISQFGHVATGLNIGSFILIVLGTILAQLFRPAGALLLFLGMVALAYKYILLGKQVSVVLVGVLGVVVILRGYSAMRIISNRLREAQEREA